VWDETDEEPVPLSWFNMSLKFGPYLPGVDDEPGLGPVTGVDVDGNTVTVCDKPFACIYGGDRKLLSQLELEWFPLHPFGQLGLFGGIGYLQTTGKSLAEDADGNIQADNPMTPNDDESRSADDTTFRLIPTYAGVVYRFTELADRTVVPLVPYAKVGLSYYMWSISKGNGKPAQTASGGTARGGTLGWQATVGLALRADAFDPGSARSLRTDFGVEHAGFFVEGTYAEVSGLGQEKKLYLGDLTWFAGINFEF
jgi:hypothetical protein